MLAVPSGMLQAVQRVHCRSLSLDSSGPQRITATAQGNGARCWQRTQVSQSHDVTR